MTNRLLSSKMRAKRFRFAVADGRINTVNVIDVTKSTHRHNLLRRIWIRDLRWSKIKDDERYQLFGTFLGIISGFISGWHRLYIRDELMSVESVQNSLQPLPFSFLFRNFELSSVRNIKKIKMCKLMLVFAALLCAVAVHGQGTPFTRCECGLPADNILIIPYPIEYDANNGIFSILPFLQVWITFQHHKPYRSICAEVRNNFVRSNAAAMYCHASDSLQHNRRGVFRPTLLWLSMNVASTGHSINGATYAISWRMMRNAPWLHSQLTRMSCAANFQQLKCHWINHSPSDSSFATKRAAK